MSLEESCPSLFSDLPANFDQQRLIGGTVVAVDFADVFAVGDFAGEGFRVVADVGGELCYFWLDPKVTKKSRLKLLRYSVPFVRCRV